MKLYYPGLFIFILSIHDICGQSHAPVAWSYTARRVSNHEIILTLTADIAPGWHLYSQFTSDEGPHPTEFIFNTQNGYNPIGKAEERGRAITHFDSTYEVKVTWFSDHVSFLQKISLREPVSQITGRIEYMVCNTHLCIPDKREFSIDVPEREP